jgi:hypothetical protein
MFNSLATSLMVRKAEGDFSPPRGDGWTTEDCDAPAVMT